MPEKIVRIPHGELNAKNTWDSFIEIPIWGNYTVILYSVIFSNKYNLCIIAVLNR